MFLLAAALVIESLQPLRTLEVPRHEQGFGVFTYARDGQHEYLGTPRGLYRTDRIATGTLEKIADQPVSAIAANANALYASFGLHNHAYGEGESHTLHRSFDRGATFVSIDEGLLDCSLTPWGEPCRYLVARQIEIADGRLFVEAKKDGSGYLAYSNNGGATWIDASPLVGDAHVELLAEDADGRLLIGLYEAGTFTLAEIVLGERESKGRVVRK